VVTTTSEQRPPVNNGQPKHLALNLALNNGHLSTTASGHLN
jgi:hypothetical protein